MKSRTKNEAVAPLDSWEYIIYLGHYVTPITQSMLMPVIHTDHESPESPKIDKC